MSGAKTVAGDGVVSVRRTRGGGVVALYVRGENVFGEDQQIVILLTPSEADALADEIRAVAADARNALAVRL